MRDGQTAGPRGPGREASRSRPRGVGRTEATHARLSGCVAVRCGTKCARCTGYDSTRTRCARALGEKCSGGREPRRRDRAAAKRPGSAIAIVSRAEHGTGTHGLRCRGTERVVPLAIRGGAGIVSDAGDGVSEGCRRSRRNGNGQAGRRGCRVGRGAALEARLRRWTPGTEAHSRGTRWGGTARDRELGESDHPCGCAWAADATRLPSWKGESGTRSLQRVRKQACARKATDDGGQGTGGVWKRHAGTESGMRKRRRGTEIQGRQEHA